MFVDGAYFLSAIDKRWDSPAPIDVAVHELVLLASKCISVGSCAIHGVLYIIRTGKMSSSQWHHCGNIPIITECTIEQFLMTNCLKN